MSLVRDLALDGQLPQPALAYTKHRGGILDPDSYWFARHAQPSYQYRQHAYQRPFAPWATPWSRIWRLP